MSNLTSVYDAIASLPSLARFATEKDWQTLASDLIRASPAMFALWTNPTRWRLAPHLAFLDQAIVEAIEDAQASRLDGLAVSMPPQHGKSELCSKYLPAWYLGTFPDRRVILVSYEADFAASWGRKARDLLAEHGSLFGVRIASRSASARRWDIDGRDGGMSAAGVGGPITGKGAHLLIVDDPIKNDEEARSPHCREKQSFVMLLVGGDGRLYVDADLAVRNTQAIIDTSLEIQQRFTPDWFAVEVNQFQQLLADMLFAAARERRMSLPIVEITNQTNKLVRIRRLTPYIMRGQVRFKGDSPGARRLVAQLRDFPHGDHDDGPDALEMAVRAAAELLQNIRRERDWGTIEIALPV